MPRPTEAGAEDYGQRIAIRRDIDGSLGDGCRGDARRGPDEDVKDLDDARAGVEGARALPLHGKDDVAGTRDGVDQAGVVRSGSIEKQVQGDDTGAGSPQPIDRLRIERPRPSNERSVSGQHLTIAPLVDADDYNGSGETFALIGEEKVGAAQLSVGSSPLRNAALKRLPTRSEKKGSDGKLLQAESWHRAILENQSRPINRGALSAGGA